MVTADLSGIIWHDVIVQDIRLYKSSIPFIAQHHLKEKLEFKGRHKFTEFIHYAMEMHTNPSDSPKIASCAKPVCVRSTNSTNVKHHKMNHNVILPKQKLHEIRQLFPRPEIAKTPHQNTRKGKCTSKARGIELFVIWKTLIILIKIIIIVELDTSIIFIFRTIAFSF